MASLKLKEESSNKCFNGHQKVYSHYSEELSSQMRFGVYIPATAKHKKVSVGYWLSGILNSEQTFIRRSGAQMFASEYKVLLVNPDTTPRNCGIEGEADYSSYYGEGVGIYVDATEEKWKINYRMYSYVTKELPKVIEANFHVSSEKFIFGHSVGGHGAIMCALKNPGLYQSVSAFCPLLNFSAIEFGQNTFYNYLGSDKDVWKEYDSTELVKKYDGPYLKIFIDVGTGDEYLSRIKNDIFLETVSKNKKVNVTLRMQEGYDHSYYFVKTFLRDHFIFHTKIQSKF